MPFYFVSVLLYGLTRQFLHVFTLLILFFTTALGFVYGFRPLFFTTGFVYGFRFRLPLVFVYLFCFILRFRAWFIRLFLSP